MFCLSKVPAVLLISCGPVACYYCAPFFFCLWLFDIWSAGDFSQLLISVLITFSSRICFT